MKYLLLILGVTAISQASINNDLEKRLVTVVCKVNVLEEIAKLQGDILERQFAEIVKLRKEFLKKEPTK